MLLDAAVDRRASLSHGGAHDCFAFGHAAIPVGARRQVRPELSDGPVQPGDRGRGVRARSDEPDDECCSRLDIVEDRLQIDLNVHRTKTDQDSAHSSICMLLSAVLSRAMRKLSTTSYAVLGLLALRPWSTYELAQQVSKSLSSWWPRTERQLYEQPKILVDHGLATATTEMVGRRPRTVYDITPDGREALRVWLDEPSSVYAWEWDAILRVFFADQGSKEQLLTTLRNTAATLRVGQAEGLEGLEEVSQPGYRYADRAHLFALMLKLEMGVCAAIDQWFEWAEQEVAGWTDITGPTDRIAYFQQVVGEVTPDANISLSKRATSRG